MALVQAKHSRNKLQPIVARHQQEIVIQVATDEVLQNSSLIQRLTAALKDAALLKRVLMKTKEDPNSSETINYAPFTLFPSPVPTRPFNQAFEVQQDFNVLADKISMDSEFLKQALASLIKSVFGAAFSSTVEADGFKARLFSIYSQVLEGGITQPITLGVNRSDYMSDKRRSERTTLKLLVHRHVLNIWGKPDEAAKILSNKAVERICKGITKMDMKLLLSTFVLDTVQMVSEEYWIARLMIERSMAIKCPNIATHLVGTKKIQQELAREGVLENYLSDDPAAVERIRATFVGLYIIDEGPEGDEIIAKALEDPGAYVLKTQREGGATKSPDMDRFALSVEKRHFKHGPPLKGAKVTHTGSDRTAALLKEL